jgi:hypothetical protein
MKPMSKVDNVTIKTSLSIDEAVSRISSKTKAISSCFAYAMATTYGTESQLVGEVSRSRIVVARARPLTHNSSKPVFTGVAIESPQGTLLKGNFEFNCFRKYFFWVSAVIFTAAELFILIGVYDPENGPLFSPRNILVILMLPGFQLAAYFFTYFFKDFFFESDKKWIEEELNRIVA